MPNWFTNRTGSKISFAITGTNVVGADFGNSFLVSSRSFDTIPSYPLVGVKVAPISVPGGGTQTVRPAEGRVMFATDLNPATTYRVDITVLRLGGQVDVTRLPVRSVERWEDPPEFETESEGPYGRFCEISSIVSDVGSTISTVEASSTFTSPSTYPVLIVGGQNLDGVVVPYAGENARVPGNRLIVDGVEKSFAALGVTNGLIGLSPAKRLVKLYTAYPEMHIQSVSFGFNRKFPNDVYYASRADFEAGNGVNLDQGTTVRSEPYYSYPGSVGSVVARGTLYRPANISGIKLAVIVPDIGDYEIRNPDSASWYAALTTGIQDLITSIRATTGLSTPVLLITPPISGTLGQNFNSAVTAVTGANITKFDSRTYMSSGLNPWGLILSEAQHSAIGAQIAAQIATLMSADLEPAGQLDFSGSRQSGLLQFLF
jgi:hypothetical protein